MKKFEVKDHAPSLVPEGKEWKLVWADEFDGTELDRSKWDYRLSMMGKRHITWTDDGVTLDGNSNAVFRIYPNNNRSVPFIKEKKGRNRYKYWYRNCLELLLYFVPPFQPDVCSYRCVASFNCIMAA